jgi:hypothetical protein
MWANCVTSKWSILLGLVGNRPPTCWDNSEERAPIGDSNRKTNNQYPITWLRNWVKVVGRSLALHLLYLFRVVPTRVRALVGRKAGASTAHGGRSKIKA